MSRARKAVGAAGTVGGLGLGLLLTLVCAAAGTDRGPACRRRGSERSGRGRDAVVLRRARPEGRGRAPRHRRRRAHVRAAHVVRQAGPPVRLDPPDFQSCVKKFTEDLTSPSAVNFSLTIRECGLQSNSCCGAPCVRPARRQPRLLPGARPRRGRRLLRRRRPRADLLARPGAERGRLRPRQRAMPRRGRRRQVRARAVPRQHQGRRQADVRERSARTSCSARRASWSRATAACSVSKCTWAPTAPRPAQPAAPPAPATRSAARATPPWAATTVTRFASTARAAGLSCNADAGLHARRGVRVARRPPTAAIPAPRAKCDGREHQALLRRQAARATSARRWASTSATAAARAFAAPCEHFATLGHDPSRPWHTRIARLPGAASRCRCPHPCRLRRRSIPSRCCCS